MTDIHKDFAGEKKPKKSRKASSEEDLSEDPLEELIAERTTAEASDETLRVQIIKNLGRLQQLLKEDLSRCLDFSLPDIKKLVSFYQSSFHTTPSSNYLAQIVSWVLARRILELPANPFAHSAGAAFFKEAAQLRSKKLIVWTTWELEEFLEGFSKEQNNLPEESE